MKNFKKFALSFTLLLIVALCPILLMACEDKPDENVADIINDATYCSTDDGVSCLKFNFETKEVTSWTIDDDDSLSVEKFTFTKEIISDKVVYTITLEGNDVVMQITVLDKRTIEYGAITGEYANIFMTFELYENVADIINDATYCSADDGVSCLKFNFETKEVTSWTIDDDNSLSVEKFTFTKEIISDKVVYTITLEDNDVVMQITVLDKRTIEYGAITGEYKDIFTQFELYEE